jgi:hypothetical protein
MTLPQDLIIAGHRGRKVSGIHLPPAADVYYKLRTHIRGRPGSAPHFDSEYTEEKKG